MSFETVYTMPDWYDGPRGGIADFDGKPHVFESCWTDIDSDADDVFLLSEISPETLAQAVEKWEIWLRWSAAFKKGMTTRETHPCLPSDRQRYDELVHQLQTALTINESCNLAATGKFRYSRTASHSPPMAQVEWTPIEFQPCMDRRERFR